MSDDQNLNQEPSQTSESIERQRWIESYSKNLFDLGKGHPGWTTEWCDKIAQRERKSWEKETSNMSNNQEHSESDFAKESAESSFRDIRSIYEAWIKETTKEENEPNHSEIRANGKIKKKRQKFLDKVAIGMYAHKTNISSYQSYDAAEHLWEERERRIYRESNPVTK